MYSGIRRDSLCCNGFCYRAMAAARFSRGIRLGHYYQSDSSPRNAPFQGIADDQPWESNPQDGMGTGMPDDGYVDKGHWLPVEPESINQALWEMACGKE